ncbi:MAG: hypothetical protein WDN50_13060 [Bradyrhizobium sp.]
MENHRASIMEKTGSKSLPALARLAFSAAGNGAAGPRSKALTQRSRPFKSDGAPPIAPSAVTLQIKEKKRCTCRVKVC